jgi:hypothetical protein
MKAAIIFDEKAQGVVGGTFTSGAWRQRDLNVERDPDGLLVVASNQVTIGATGKYFIHCSCPAYAVGRHQSRLLKNGAVLKYGSIEFTNAYPQSPSLIVYTGDLTANDVLKLEHQCATTVASYGFGVENTWGVGIFSVMQIFVL